MQQKIPVGNNGADSRRVLDALTPINGTTAPAAHAIFLGQIYVDTTAKKVYASVAVNSTSPADDWVEITTTV